ncbi:DUF1611 domain-containing protein [Novosphingobium sp. NPDC080210]|uniref:DUF1611 domain-containing protein n=1 Tax=Novosphingobium sp. NPDC080210 TaxID=3390596 RepID=UPI003D058743
MQNASFTEDRIARARKSFTTRRVDFTDVKGLLRSAKPAAGDLVLARVEVIGQHARLEEHLGRRAKLYPGDEIIVAYGARYAPDQFEAEVPADLSPCDLVAGGGVAARVLSRHSRMSKATRISPVGLLLDAQGQTINLRHYALPETTTVPDISPRVMAVVGSSMNAGKTTTAAGLVHGLARAGLRVAGIKVTGTGSGGDLWSMADAGAEWTLDFTDMGHATTAGLPEAEVERIATGLVRHTASLGADIIILEVADGLFQRETGALVGSHGFHRMVDGVVFAAGDALGAIGGIEWLRQRGLPVIALSGLLTASPLAMREAAAHSEVPVMTLTELLDPHSATRLCFGHSPQHMAQVA